MLVLLLLALLANNLAASETRVLNRRILEGEPGFDLVSQLTHYELHDFSQHASTRRALSQQHSPQNMEYTLRVFDQDVVLDLQPHSELFSKDYAHHLLAADGTILSKEPALTCMFRGVQRGSELDSQVFGQLCTSDKFSLSVLHRSDSAKSFSVEPHGGLHVVYRHLDMVPSDKHCGNTFLEQEEEEEHSPPPRHLRQLLSTNKVVGVSVVNDFKRYQYYAKQVHAHAANLFGVSDALFRLLGTVRFPSVYSVSLQLLSMYTYTNGDPWTHPNSPAGEGACSSSSCSTVYVSPSGEVDAERTLFSFNTWRDVHVRPDDNALTGHDIAHLLTGYTFTGNTIGLALTGAACTGSRSSTTQATALTDAQIASTITHEIGHNLGVKHTGGPGPFLCPDNSTTQYIMSSTSSVANTNWESCSPQYLSQFFDSPAYVNNPCLEDTNVGPVVYDGNPVCGDGLVQGSEQCDCINNDCAVVDPCCNGLTCTLLPTSQCSLQDVCCNAQCRISNNTQQVCRESLSPGCDVAETCDGVSSKCPFDKFNATGTPCITELTGSSGTCFYKECKDAKEDCYKLGLAQPQPGDQWDATCSSETLPELNTVGECTAYCKLSSDPANNPCKYFTSSVVTYTDGVQCQTGKACFQGQCTAFNEIPVQTNVNCTNQVLDALETDVDCGGLECFGCAAGKLCQVNRDCAFPGLCNMTLTFTNSRGVTGLGVCSRSGNVGQGANDVLQEVLDWLQANLVYWVPPLAVFVFLLLLCCCCSCGKNKKPVAQVGMMKVQQSFRNFQQRNGEGGIPTASLVVQAENGRRG